MDVVDWEVNKSCLLHPYIRPECYLFGQVVSFTQLLKYIFIVSVK